MSNPSITETVVNATVTSTAITASLTQQAITASIDAAIGLTTSAGDARYARLAAANTLTQGPNAFRPGGQNPIEIQSDAGAVLAHIDSAGRGWLPQVGVGPNALLVDPDPVTKLTALFSTRDTSTISFPAGTYGGIYRLADMRFFLTISGMPTGTHNTVDGYSTTIEAGADATGHIELVNGFDLATYWDGPADTIDLIGMNSYVESFGGNVTQMRALYVEVSNYAGTATTAYGLQVEADLSDHPITTKYGVYIGNQATAQVTNPYAIYTNGGAHRFGDYLDLAEIATPGSPSNTHGRLFCRDNAGKTQLCIKWESGTVTVLASEP